MIGLSILSPNGLASFKRDFELWLHNVVTAMHLHTVVGVHVENVEM